MYIYIHIYILLPCFFLKPMDFALPTGSTRSCQMSQYMYIHLSHLYKSVGVCIYMYVYIYKFSLFRVFLRPTGFALPTGSTRSRQMSQCSTCAGSHLPPSSRRASTRQVYIYIHIYIYVYVYIYIYI